jgi:dTDP-4-dehydrorhamnose reductase
MKNILITGSNGYIAKSLYTELKYIYNIDTVNRSNINLLDFDQCKKYFSNKFYDVVIHAAITGGSRLITDDHHTLDKNLRMYYNLTSFSNSFKKFITFGSGAEVHSKNTPYGLSKYVIAESMKDKENFYNLRVYAAFDENELDTRFIKSCILKCKKNQSIEIYKDKQMDFFYMKDLIAIVKKYIEEDNLIKTLDCCYNEKFLLSDIAKYINFLFKNKKPLCMHEDGIATPYVGKFFDYGIPYVGLHGGIINTINCLK